MESPRLLWHARAFFFLSLTIRVDDKMYVDIYRLEEIFYHSG
jgi:hypothetical protein